VDEQHGPSVAASAADVLPPDEDRFGFWRFARHPFFIEVNRWLVDRVAALGPRIVDLACGPGAITELLLARMREHTRGIIYAVDPSLAELDRARRRIASSVVRFVHGSAENLSRLVPQVDVVVFCNAIHLIGDKERVLREIRSVLDSGGALAFNTTYFKGCYVPGSERFWRSWVVRAARLLQDSGITVTHTHAGRAAAMRWRTPEEYAQLLSSAGFVRPSWELQKVEMSPESLEDIGQFSMFIEGALPGVRRPETHRPGGDRGRPTQRDRAEVLAAVHRQRAGITRRPRALDWLAPSVQWRSTWPSSSS
jgi:ubiquinone/menaquinone biosynthesis C-methylase UbiE